MLVLPMFYCLVCLFKRVRAFAQLKCPVNFWVMKSDYFKIHIQAEITSLDKPQYSSKVFVNFLA